MFLHTVLVCWETEHRGFEVVSWMGSARASEREPASWSVSYCSVALRLMSTSCKDIVHRKNAMSPVCVCEREREGARARARVRVCVRSVCQDCVRV